MAVPGRRGAARHPAQRQGPGGLPGQRDAVPLLRAHRGHGHLAVGCHRHRVSDFGAFRQIRVGSPSETVSGTADYVVRYRLAHIVNDIGDGTAEFYYNVVDPSNGFPQLDVSATVTGPALPGDPRPVLRRARLDRPVRGHGRPDSTFAVPDLEAEQGRASRRPTPALGPSPTCDPEADSGDVVSPASARVLGWVAIGPASSCRCSRRPHGAARLDAGEGRAVCRPHAGPDPASVSRPVVVGGPEPTVAVQFTPPAGVQPGMVGTIVDEEVNLVDVTATLVDLAVRGHLRIARDDQGVFRADDWVTRTGPPADAVASHRTSRCSSTRCSPPATAWRCRS